MKIIASFFVPVKEGGTSSINSEVGALSTCIFLCNIDMFALKWFSIHRRALPGEITGCKGWIEDILNDPQRLKIKEPVASIYQAQVKWKVYLMPVDHAGASQMNLRLVPTRNNQEKNVRWAHDYEL